MSKSLALNDSRLTSTSSLSLVGVFLFTPLMKKLKSRSMERIQIYTDGACDNLKTKRGAFAWVAVGLEEYAFLWPEKTTNNQMEMRAILDAMTKFDGSPADIFSDSMYCVDGLNKWTSSWEKNNWVRKKGEIKNLDIWKEMHELFRRNDFTLSWVRGHAGNVYNECADGLANAKLELAVGGFDAKRFNRTRIWQPSPSF